jgi:6-phosphofructokinase 2
MRPAPTFFVASGSMPAGVPERFLARVARAAEALGAKVVVDTSGPALAAALGEGVFLIKPNLRELQELVGFPLKEREQQLAAARTLIEKQAVETVALTLGHLGALLVTQRQAFYAPALPVGPVSVVGAGDSFLGAMVWSLDAGQGIEDAFRHGVAAGSAALLSAGTGLCKAEDVRRLYPQVQLQRL